MNKTYRSIWSDTDQTWVAVAETTRSHRKSSRRSAVLTTGALGIVASLVSTGAFAAGTVGQGGLEICSGVKGYSWGATGSSATLDCSAGSSGVSDGLAFSLNNAGDTNGGYGFDASTARVAGYQNGTLDIKGTNVLVHGPTTFDSIVSMSNQKITNLRPGEISATSTDAINGSQVYAAISKLGDAVFYDTASHNAVTLGDAAAMEPVALHNVANGTLSADSLDAVNGAQLYDAMLQAGGAAHYVGINSAAGSGNYNGEGANGVDTIAIGANASAGAYNSVAMGTGSTASGNYAISFGNQATAAEASIAVGAHSAATEWNDIAIGFGTSAYGGTSIAVGLNSTAAGYHSMAMGGAALTQGSFATALGDSASAISSQGTALGAGAVSTNPGDVALGAGSITDVVAGTSGTTIRGSEYGFAGANPASTVSIGGVGSERTITNLAAGRISESSTDAINGSQLYATNQAIEKLSNPYIDGTGTGLPAAQATGLNSVALGLGSVADGLRTVSVGNAATGLTRKITNVARGSADTDAANVAQLNDLWGAVRSGLVSFSAQLGANTSAIAALDASSANPPSMLGATSGNLVGVGSVDADALHYDSSTHASVTLSSTTNGNVSLSGLQNAALTASSTDAVTGQQLYATNQQVANINQAVQNISMNGTTAVSANSTSGAAAASGTQAIAVGGGALASGANSTALGDKANASASNAVAIGANSVADRDNAVSVGAVGSERQITNVATGTSGTDAVNLNQLNGAIAQQSNALGQQISNLQGSINTVSKNAYAGVAAAMAMPNLTPSGPGRTLVAAGGGYYMGGSAAAVGVTYRSTNMHWLMNGAVSVTSTGNPAVRAQVGYEF